MGRSRSYSRSRSPAPRERGGGRSGGYGGGDRENVREPPTRTSILLRNVSDRVTGDDIRYHAGKFGIVKDVYLPKDYYSGRPRGIAFIEFTSSRDADEALRGLDRSFIGGREVQATYAQQGRKRPDDFRRMGAAPRGDYGRNVDRRDYRGRDNYHDRDRDRDRRRRSYSRSRSRDRRRSRSRSASRGRDRRRVSRSPPPPRERESRSRSRSASKSRSRSRSRSHSRGRSPARDASPRKEHSDGGRRADSRDRDVDAGADEPRKSSRSPARSAGSDRDRSPDRD